MNMMKATSIYMIIKNIYQIFRYSFGMKMFTLVYSVEGGGVEGCTQYSIQY